MVAEIRASVISPIVDQWVALNEFMSNIHLIEVDLKCLHDR